MIRQLAILIGALAQLALSVSGNAAQFCRQRSRWAGNLFGKMRCSGAGVVEGAASAFPLEPKAMSRQVPDESQHSHPGSPPTKVRFM